MSTNNMNVVADESSSAESIADDTDKDPDYIFNDVSYLSDSTYELSESRSSSTQNIVIDFIDFDEWDDLSLDRIAKRKSNSEVWNYFGILKKGNTIFEPLSKKIYCQPCFDARKFKG